ncbi:2-amino-4-hydroxy-6-hydroxymethyldihydropteridine diphosphokinase [Bacillus sp. 03113]|uniref:2-amino-4-hydroxy-6- hydroxymethyldihydropteridine diphosphokinase n=1 Tax=Bacillus sp. 03113 TaxID=2578211 RepID=UPI0011450B39|nr:2-amino-4-hydroxy-6-hydroxymethyldihydropteridine diphosphokinase [Bacillus sp. 03113]
MENNVYLSLGSNMGNREQMLTDAIVELHKNDKITLVNVSSIYETDPVGYEDQDLFLNMVIHVSTALSPYELLDACQSIEKSLGRKREIHWGPRTVDLDILLYNQENIKSEELTIPHPRMCERAFVIVPLYEIYLDSTLPMMDIPLKTLLEELPDREGVRIWKQKNGEDVFELFEN